MLRIKDKGVTAKGGTVYVLQAYDFDSLDPANNYRTNGQEVGRLIYRTLTFIKDTPGEAPSIQPDLAESSGHPQRRRADLDLQAACGPQIRRRPADHRAGREIRRHALLR